MHPAIFENELYAWHTEKAAWPQGRDLVMCKAYFEIELHSAVEDLCDDEIVDEEMRPNPKVGPMRLPLESLDDHFLILGRKSGELGHID